MLRKSTAEIITICTQAINQYQSLQGLLFETPGQKGMQRKTAFLILLKKINDYEPKEAVIAIYDFHIAQSHSIYFHSRLNEMIKYILMRILEIPEPIINGSIHASAANIKWAEKTLHAKMKKMKEEMGVDCELDIPLLTLRLH